MPEYPVKDGLGADVVTGYDVDTAVFTPRSPAGDYPVKDGLGNVLIATAPTLTKTWPTRPDGARVVARYPVKDGLGDDIIIHGPDGGAPLLLAGAKIATLGDSIIARGHSSTTAGARTTAQNRANSELTWALARSPRGLHTIYWDAAATAALDIPTYGFASAQDNLWRGANFGYSGDTALGITRRVQQVINSGAQVCFLSIGTNTDAPNTAVEKIARIDAAVTALTAANIYVILGTIRPRWSGERATRNNVLSTTSGSAVIRLVETNHGLTNTSAATKNMEFVSGGVTIAGLTLSGVISSGTGGYTVNVVDANTIDITCPTTANATVASGGGTFTYHRNTFVDAAGVNNVGLGLLPSDVRHQVHREVNDWIIAQAGRSKVVVADMTAALRDPVRSAATGVYLEPYPYVIMDGVHASARGAALGGAVIEAALAQIIQPGFAFDADPTVSNLLTNGRFTGTAGTANSGCSGTMPNNTFVSNVSGAAQPVTGVASVEANAETGGQSVVLALNSTGAGAANTFNVIRFSHTNPAAGFISTDWVQAIYEIELSGAESGVMPAFQATIGQTSTISNRGLGQTRTDYNTEPYPTENRRYWIQTEPLLVGARTGLNPRLDFAIRTDLAGSVTVRVRRAFLRIVPNPATQFPWVP